MGDYDLLKVLSLATLLWALFFLNLMLPNMIDKNAFLDTFLWNLLYICLLIPALIVTLVVIAESLKNIKQGKKVEQEA
jgi:hypothetical protein